MLQSNREIARRPARILAAAFMVLIPALAFAAAEAESAPQPGPAGSPAPVIASVDYLEGEVFVDGEPAYFGMPLAPGARIVVGEDSACDVVFGENIVRIHPETSAVVDIGRVTSRIAVDEGAISAVFEKLQVLGNDGHFNFDTPTAVGGVRGTVFYVRVENPDSTFVCVCNGSVALDSVDGGRDQLLSAAHHSGLRFKRGADGTISTEVPEMAYHDDEDMESLAARIGAEIDWSTVN